MKRWLIGLIVLAVLGLVALVLTFILGAKAVSERPVIRYDAAKGSSVWLDLRTVRSMIESYKQDHNGSLPGVGVTGTFEQCMTKQTDSWGNSGSGCGPYLQKIPTNAFNGLDTVDVSGTGVIGDDSHGWAFNPKTGYFQADDSAKHER